MKHLPCHHTTTLLAVALFAAGACGDTDEHNHNEEEVITTVTLTFTPSAGSPVVAVFNDPDGDGGAAPTTDMIALAKNQTYITTVKFENRLETPAEDITVEVKDEGDQHQVFFTGSAVSGPASASANAPLVHAYADTDAKGLPLGLANTMTASATGGTGQLTLTLRHMPPVNNTPVKTADTANAVKSGGLAAIGGATDVNVTFNVNVQ